MRACEVCGMAILVMSDGTLAPHSCPGGGPRTAYSAGS